MGKVTGFLEIQREQPTRRKAGERIKDWFEIYEPFPEEKQREQGARCMDCGVPFCHTGCPVNNLIPDWNDLVYNNRWQAAIRRLHSTNNFPEFTGRICPAPCEAACVLGINQPPVSIKLIERSIVERAWDEGWIHPEPPEQATGKRVAVVGSGPAGLAAAQQLRRAGHSVTVFEKNDRIGGLLRYGIPNFKLEKHVLDRRIEQMKAEGVIFQANAHVGVNVSVESLTEGFDAILLCGGAEAPRDLPIPGRELKGIHFAMSSSAAATPAQTASAPAIVRARKASTSSRSCRARPRSAPPQRPGRCGRCNCALKARTRKAASATGASIL
jgi:glutamate synthase (NADPH/NADH) small chain